MPRLGHGCAVALLLLLAVACSGGEDRADPDPDAGFTWGDAGPTRIPSCPAEADEDCSGCYEHVGLCCYEGEGLARWQAASPAMSAGCAADPLCAACCDECVAMSCAQILENDVCPVAEPQP